MEDKDIIRQLQGLRDLKPDETWAYSAKNGLISRIEAQNEYQNKYRIRDLIASPKYAGSFAFGVVLLMLASIAWAQASLPGSLFYPLKLASEDIRANMAASSEAQSALRAEFAYRRLEEARAVAADTLEEETAQQFIVARLEKTQEELKQVSDAGNTEAIDKKAREATELAKEVRTSARNQENLWLAMRDKAAEMAGQCADEKLKQEALELLDEGGTRNIAEAYRLVTNCPDSEAPAPRQEGEEK